MACNNGLHGALYRDYRGRWFCMICHEEIDYKDLEEKRQEAKSKPKDKDDNS